MLILSLRKTATFNSKEDAGPEFGSHLRQLLFLTVKLQTSAIDVKNSLTLKKTADTKVLTPKDLKI